VRIRILRCQRHRIRSPLIRSTEVAIVLVKRRHPQVLALALVRRLVKLNPLLRPRRAPRLRSLRCRIRVPITQWPRRRIPIRRPAAGTARTAAGAAARTRRILQRPYPRRPRRILPWKRELRRRRSARTRFTRLPIRRRRRTPPGERKTLRRIRTPRRRTLCRARRCGLPIRRRRRLPIRRLTIRRILAIRPEHRLPTLIRKRASTLVLSARHSRRQHQPNPSANQPQSSQHTHTLHTPIRRHPAPPR
jgi:hypothetical protein